MPKSESGQGGIVEEKAHREEDENVTFEWLSGMDLEHGRDCSMQIIRFWIRSVVNVHLVSAARHCNSR